MRSLIYLPLSQIIDGKTKIVARVRQDQVINQELVNKLNEQYRQTGQIQFYPARTVHQA